MRVVVTGADGFLGRNLRWRLREQGMGDVLAITRATPESEWPGLLVGADAVFHLSGVNRPEDPAEFELGNAVQTRRLCDLLRQGGSNARVVLASSTQATLDNPYGRSKRAAESALMSHAQSTGAPVSVFRLPNVFGKWSRPFYNSAVATFCHQVARGLAVSVNDPNARLRLVYVDDVVDAFVAQMHLPRSTSGFAEVAPVYDTTVGSVAESLQSFMDGRNALSIDRVGTGLTRALYATFVSFLPAASFAYDVPQYSDPRGVFVEMLKTPDCGQFSYFTASPGVTRGGHYHHTKTEKFLVIKGTARFSFRNIDTGQTHELTTRGNVARIVETIPGWTHDITNIGDDELVVMLWANEVFDRQRPDTVAMPVKT